jgi:hypothetical protein
MLAPLEKRLSFSVVGTTKDESFLAGLALRPSDDIYFGKDRPIPKRMEEEKLKLPKRLGRGRK